MPKNSRSRAAPIMFHSPSSSHFSSSLPSALFEPRSKSEGKSPPETTCKRTQLVTLGHHQRGSTQLTSSEFGTGRVVVVGTGICPPICTVLVARQIQLNRGSGLGSRLLLCLGVLVVQSFSLPQRLLHRRVLCINILITVTTSINYNNNLIQFLPMSTGSCPSSSLDDDSPDDLKNSSKSLFIAASSVCEKLSSGLS